MSIQAVKYVLDRSEIYGQSRMVLLALAYHANPAGLTWPGYELLTRECRMRKAAVCKSLEVLLRSGEVEISAPGGPRRSTQYRLVKFVKSLDVGGTTLDTPEGQGESWPRKSVVPEAKTWVSLVPTVTDETSSGSHYTEGTVSGSRLYSGNRERAENRPNGNHQGGPTGVDSVPTVTDGTRNLKNRQSTRESSRALRRADSPAVTQPPLPPAVAEQPSNGGFHSAYVKLLLDGKSREQALAELRASGAYGANKEAPAPADPTLHESRQPHVLRTMREILAHARALAAGQEPPDFADQDYRED